MALKVLLDTHRLTDAFRGEPEVVRTLESAADILLPFVAVAEIKAGFAAGGRSEDNEKLLHRFLQLPGVGILYADRETLDVYARLFTQLRRSGTPVPTNDLWIASLAVQHGLPVMTRDRHFVRIPQIARL